MILSTCVCVVCEGFCLRACVCVCVCVCVCAHVQVYGCYLPPLEVEFLVPVNAASFSWPHLSETPPLSASPHPLPVPLKPTCVPHPHLGVSHVCPEPAGEPKLLKQQFGRTLMHLELVEGSHTVFRYTRY